MNHSFDIEHARLYGLPEAIILHNVLFWLAHNKAFGRNIREGKPWTFNSVVAYSKLFPYFTPDKIRRYFESLEKQNVLLVANFNQKKYDKTKWHTVADQSMIPVFGDPLANSPKARMPNGNGEFAEPIPDINTDEKQIAILPQPFKESKPKKAKNVSRETIHPDYSIARDLMISLDNSFMETKVIRDNAIKAIKAHGLPVVLSAIRGRAIVQSMTDGKKYWWSYLFSDEVAFHACIKKDEAEASKVLNMRARFNPEPAKMTPEDMAAIEKSLNAI